MDNLSAATTNHQRRSALLEAQQKAEILFQTIEAGDFIRAGIGEKELNQQIYELAYEMFGIKKYWHKRIVRAGVNTLCPYRENPPDLIIKEDDILFFDFGPVFEEWEADFGRTYVLGADPEKLRIKNEIAIAWDQGKIFFDRNPNITGSELYAYVTSLALERGFTYGQEHCGHLIGNFPHEKLQGEEIENYIHPANKLCMRDADKNGKPRDWILEIHFINQEKQFGGFFEQLLTI